MARTPTARSCSAPARSSRTTTTYWSGAFPMAAPTTATLTSVPFCGATRPVRVTDTTCRRFDMSSYDWGQRHPGIDRLEEQISEARGAVIAHPLYAALDNHRAIRTFQEHHVFAVWDFMSLLKSLQRNLTCVEVPWVPTGPTGSRRLINDIVPVEESDELGGGFISHFELYLDGMTEASADTSVINAFIDGLRPGRPLLDAIDEVNVPRPPPQFVRPTRLPIETPPPPPH